MSDDNSKSVEELIILPLREAFPWFKWNDSWSCSNVLTSARPDKLLCYLAYFLTILPPCKRSYSIRIYSDKIKWSFDVGIVVYHHNSHSLFVEYRASPDPLKFSYWHYVDEETRVHKTTSYIEQLRDSHLDSKSNCLYCKRKCHEENLTSSDVNGSLRNGCETSQSN